ncbi:MAG: DnaJ domain-containing protein [Spirochaetes bacterium]|nr:DnaJ domain-containing protein [Spirochaetota bacterium]
MKSIKHITSIIEFCNKKINEMRFHKKSAYTYKILIEQNVKLRKKTALKVINEYYKTKINDLLRDLSKEIKDRESMVLLFNLIDEAYKSILENEQSKNNIKNLQIKNLKKKYNKYIPALRKKKINEVLLEEMILRELTLSISESRIHCHIWKKYFDYHDDKKLEKLIQMKDSEFNTLAYLCANELALYAQEHLSLKKFNWKKFSYTGININGFYDTEQNREYNLKILELSENASSYQIKQQYKKMAKKHHPDRGGKAADMIRINIAYENLFED